MKSFSLGLWSVNWAQSKQNKVGFVIYLLFSLSDSNKENFWRAKSVVLFVLFLFFVFCFSFPQCYGFKQLPSINGSLCKPSPSDRKYWPFGLPQLLCSCILHALILHSSFFRLCYFSKVSLFQKHVKSQVIFKSGSTFNVNHQFCILFS